jgi:purine catabolism regulator
VAAGLQGLDRVVKWVHVVEVTQIRNLLHGNELILSTGVGWREETGLFISLLRQLIDAQAAGLCIEIGMYTSKIPQEVIEIANKHHFPIILFHQEVPFVEITQDIHTLLINNQYKIISDIESYSQALNKKLLTISHHNEILKFIQQYLQVQTVIQFANKEIQFVPEVTEEKQTTYLDIINRNNSVSSLSEQPTISIAKIPIHLLDSNYGELMIISEKRALTEFDHLILDRTATALTQLFLRELYVEEKQRVKDTEWLTRWLDGEQDEESIKEYLAFHAPMTKPKGALVCICKLDSREQYSPIDLTYFKLYFRTIFEQQGFSLFAIEKRNSITFIFINERNSASWKKRMREGMNRFVNSKIKIGSHQSKLLRIAIGRYVEELTKIHLSYQTSLETLRIQHQLTNESECYFYDDLHIFRLISLLNRHLNLQEIVREYLEPVMDYDKKYNGKLMETLKTYLSCNGSKQETAKRLFIVRQTLYHRIQKLEKLLGEDFMNHEKRLAIEFMVFAHEFLVSSKQTEQRENEAY